MSIEKCPTDQVSQILNAYWFIKLSRLSQIAAEENHISPHSVRDVVSCCKSLGTKKYSKIKFKW